MEWVSDYLTETFLGKQIFKNVNISKQSDVMSHSKVIRMSKMKHGGFGTLLEFNVFKTLNYRDKLIALKSKNSSDNMESLIASTPHVFIMDRKKIHENVDRQHYSLWRHASLLITNHCFIVKLTDCDKYRDWFCSMFSLSPHTSRHHRDCETFSCQANHKLDKNFFAYYSIFRRAQLRFMNCDDLPEVSSRIKEECVLWWFMK